MNRAEERALEYLPETHKEDYDCEEEWIDAEVRNRSDRLLYTNAYLQAEKDLALTKDDVWCIFNLVRELQTKYPATEGCLQEVADIFNEQRNGYH